MNLKITYFPLEGMYHVWDKDADYATIAQFSTKMEATRYKAEQEGQGMLRIELVWNREFNWSVFGYASSLEIAKTEAIDIRDSGDGARVKKVRVLDNETDEVLWNG